VQGYSITEHDPDEGPIYLGAVTDPLHRPTEQVEAIIDSAWPDFQETKPDADSEFIPYLVEHYGFTEADENHQIVVGK